MFNLAPLSLTDATNAQGIANLNVIVPGTLGKLISSRQTNPNKVFGGPNKGKTEGRWLDRIVMWSDTFVPGDNVSRIRLVDSDRVLSVDLIAKFPNHPLIYDYLERKGPETLKILHAIYLHPTLPLDYKPASAPLFLPADLSLEIQFTAGVAAAGRVVRCVVYWGHLGVD